MRGILCLCGSTRFREQFEEVNRRLTWSGWIVLSVGSFHHSEKDHSVADQIIKRKVKLDALHKEKIALSQAIVVIDVNGYIGKSTISEMEHAIKLGKQIYTYEYNTLGLPFPDHEKVNWPHWSKLLDESPDDLEVAPK